MKPLLLILLFASALFAQNAIVSVDKIKLRSFPTEKGKVTGEITKDEPITILLQDNGWSLIQSSRVSGWLPDSAVTKKPRDITLTQNYSRSYKDQTPRMVNGRCMDNTISFEKDKATACKDHGGVDFWYADQAVDDGRFIRDLKSRAEIPVKVGMFLLDFKRGCLFGALASDSVVTYEDVEGQYTRIFLLPLAGRRFDCVGRFEFLNERLAAMTRLQ